MRRKQHASLAARLVCLLGSLACVAAAIFQRIVDEIGDRLPDQFAAAVNEEVRLRIDFEREAALLGDRLVKFADVARDELAGVEIDHAFAAGSPPPRARSSGARRKSRIRRSDSSITFSSARAIVLRTSCRIAAPASARLRSRVSGVLRSCAILSETSLQAGHQFADAIQHGVEVLHQPVEFVAGSGDRQPAREIAGDDASAPWR